VFSEKRSTTEDTEDTEEMIFKRTYLCVLCVLRGGELSHSPFLTHQNFSGWNIAQLRYTSSRIDTMPDTM
jgi:hypothetical protein